MTTQECPFCKEDIKLEAKKCKHCGELLDPVLRAAAESKNNGAQHIINVAGGSSSASSSAASSSSSGNKKRGFRITCLDWILIFLTGGLWLIVVFLRR